MKRAAVLVAAGSGERLRAGLAKAWVPLAGRPLLVWAAEAFRRAAVFTEIVVVAPAGELDRARSLVPYEGELRWTVVAGGARRQDSVRAGVAALSRAIELVSVHDVARPLVSPELIRRVVRTAERSGAAIAALPAADTVHLLDDSGMIVSTPSREHLRLAQTPQTFRRDLLVRAHEKALAEGRADTDDAALVAALGHPVSIEPGEESNRKITVPADLDAAEAFLAGRAQQ